jgi:plasmid stabilization system protein ParE
VRVVWTLTALGHLESIHQFVARTSPAYAALLLDRILERGAQIGAFPHSGRVVPERQREDIREVFEPPYRLMYQVTADAVYVLAVIHGRRADLGELP